MDVPGQSGGAALIAPLAGGAVIAHYGADGLWAACATVGTPAAAGYAALMRSVTAD